MSKDELAARDSRWTRIDEYFGALARRRTARRSRQAPPVRTQPEAPRLLLSTLPFAALLSILAVLAIAFVIAAWPGRPDSEPLPPPAAELGTAPSGWLDEAKKEMR